jgi:hypothetical protein
MGTLLLYNVRVISLIYFCTQWKKYLTSMQIIQFIIDLFIVYFGSEFPNLLPDISLIPVTAYQHYAATHYPHLPHWSNCAGTEAAALFGCGLLTSYLGLFINFYVQTYKKPVKGKKSGTNGIANGHAHNENRCANTLLLPLQMLRSPVATKGSERDIRLRDDTVDGPYDQRLLILISPTRNINI